MTTIAPTKIIPTVAFSAPKLRVVGSTASSQKRAAAAARIPDVGRGRDADRDGEEARPLRAAGRGRNPRLLPPRLARLRAVRAALGSDQFRHRGHQYPSGEGRQTGRASAERSRAARIAAAAP